jgi:hypothetical protein
MARTLPLQLDSWLTWCSPELQRSGLTTAALRRELVDGPHGGDDQYPPYPDVLQAASRSI